MSNFGFDIFYTFLFLHFNKIACCVKYRRFISVTLTSGMKNSNISILYSLVTSLALSLTLSLALRFDFSLTLRLGFSPALCCSLRGLVVSVLAELVTSIAFSLVVSHQKPCGCHTLIMKWQNNGSVFHNFFMISSAADISTSFSNIKYGIIFLHQYLEIKTKKILSDFSDKEIIITILHSLYYM